MGFAAAPDGHILNTVLFALFMVCVLELGLATLLLVLAGRRLRVSSRLLGLLVGCGLIYAAGRLVVAIWSIGSGPVVAAESLLAAILLVVVALRPEWNPVGQVFFTSFAAAALAYLVFAADVTVAGHLSVVASIASAGLFLLEAGALAIASTFAFETCDVLCRTRHTRPFPSPSPQYQPFVSLHIPAYNEPPEMLIETIRAAEAIDYPSFEVVVIDNNTDDPAGWGPVAEYCQDRPRVRFVHVEGLEGYKSGALNLVLGEHTDARAELVGVIDADYVVDPSYLRDTVGYFADPELAFLQSPQDYRDYEQSSYFTACYDAYRYFFSMAMPSRNERNSIIFAGTMGLLRRRLLEEVGGWDEWVITEDADASLRLLRAGYSGLFIARSYGRGIMPLTFASLKSQRFRWCFGGMQILRRHWRSLMPWDRSPDNRLSIAQRLDYLVGGFQWLNDLVYLGFSVVLAIVVGLLLAGDHVPIRPFVGPTVILPAALLASGLLRATWALRSRSRISYRRALLAFANWLSLSWTVALACLQGLLRSEGTFLRTPKTRGESRWRDALVAARVETLFALALLGGAIALAVGAHPTALLVALVCWQGLVYASAPVMSWLNQRAELRPELERRRRTEERRERLARVMRPLQAGTLVAGGAGLVFVVVMALGATNPGHPTNPFQVPKASPSPPPPSPVSGRSSHHAKGGGSTSSTSSTTSSSTSTSSTSTTSSSTSSTTSPASTTTTSSPPTSTSTTTTISSATTTSTSSP